MLIGIDASRAVAAERTGTENYSFYLIRALLQAGAAHRFRLYFNQAPRSGNAVASSDAGAPTDRGTELFPRDARVEWRILPFPRLWTHLRLAWELERHPPDVLFVPSHVLPLIHPRRCVATVHDLGYVHYPQAHTARARWYLDWSTRFNARVARRVIVDSMATRDDLVILYRVDPAKLVLAYPAGAEGLAPVSDVQRLDVVRERYATGARYFLYVGTLQPRKNLSALMRAFASLAADGVLAPDVRLVLAGKRGWLYDEIVQLAQAAHLQERVVLPGYVAREDLAALLSGALAFVLPSWYEGFGLPVLEAMACDTPVICSDVSSLPEVAGDAALLVDPHDVAGLAQAMRRVYEDGALRQQLVTRGRERVRAFSWQQCAQKVLATLERVGQEP